MANFFIQIITIFWTSSLINSLPADAWLQNGNPIDNLQPTYCKIAETLQGEYKRQDNSKKPKIIANGIREPVAYEDYFIGPTSVPHWGDCYEKFGQSYIFGLKKVGGLTCFRCFTLIQRTPNLVQVVTTGENQCYDTVESARQTCQYGHAIDAGKGIMLWKAELDLRQFCPMDGRAYLKYSHVQGLRCEYSAVQTATISNCARGHQMDVEFRGCNFPNYNMSLACLGSWEAGRGNGETFFAVFNQYAQEYRCGIYRDTRTTQGYAVAALSNDSSCDSLLRNSTDGYEMFAFYPVSEPNWPTLAQSCTLPHWMQGNWGQLLVDGQFMTYTDTYTSNTKHSVNAMCVDAKSDKIRIYSRTHCGEAIGYHCMWLQRRSSDVMEFRLSNVVLRQDDAHLCDQVNFDHTSPWQTVATTPIRNLSPCPHLGHFTTPPEHRTIAGDCFNVTTDCTRNSWTRIVSYKCSTGAIFDSRNYYCLGSWKEGDYYYSYKSVGLSNNETTCFVSKYEGNRLYVKITGKTCERDIDFRKQDNFPSFVLEQTDECRDNIFSTIRPDRTTPIKPTKPPEFDDRSFRRDYPNRTSQGPAVLCTFLLSFLVLTAVL